MFIAGKERPLKFGINQTDLYCTLRGISVTQMNEEFQRFADGNYTGGEIRDLIWSALKDGARKEGIEFDLTNFDIGDAMEDLKEGELDKALAAMAEGMPKDRGNGGVAVKKKAGQS